MRPNPCLFYQEADKKEVLSPTLWFQSVTECLIADGYAGALPIFGECYHAVGKSPAGPTGLQKKQTRNYLHTSVTHAPAPSQSRNSCAVIACMCLKPSPQSNHQ